MIMDEHVNICNTILAQILQKQLKTNQADNFFRIVNFQYIIQESILIMINQRL